MQKINLKNHIKSYHEEKRCNSRCLQKGHLKVHFESVHEGKKELSCDLYNSLLFLIQKMIWNTIPW